MIDKRIRKKIRKLVKLVSKTRQDVNKQTYETVNPNRKDQEQPKKTIQLGYCYRGLTKHLCEQYISGEINEAILDYLIEVNQNGKTVSS